MLAHLVTLFLFCLIWSLVLGRVAPRGARVEDEERRVAWCVVSEAGSEAVGEVVSNLVLGTRRRAPRRTRRWMRGPVLGDESEVLKSAYWLGEGPVLKDALSVLL